jgi:predicted GNAT family acetyltransferase
MSQTQQSTPVTDNAARSRFELDEGGLIAFADYQREGGRLVIPHVETPPALRGGGVAGRLMAGVALHARAEGLKIVPLCSYAAAWMRRHPEHGDLLA